MDYILSLMNIYVNFKLYAVLLSVTRFYSQLAFAVTKRGEVASSQLHVSHPLYLEHC